MVDAGKSAVCLDATDETIQSLQLDPAVEDFSRCFRQMTGTALPRTQEAARFDPTQPRPLRVECAVGRIGDGAAGPSSNATVGIVLSPTLYFENDPLAGEGEKIAWSCTWNRAARQYEFALATAKDPYYGPGYGPFTFVTSTAGDAGTPGTGGLRLCLEMRKTSSAGVRGGYALNGGPWVYTKWFDPTRAGTDKRMPGESDKNGPQAWKPDWPDRWTNATAAFVTAYGPKGHAALVTIKSVKISQDGKDLFTGAGRPDPVGPWAWSFLPRQGKVSYKDQSAVLEPSSDAWSTVGLRVDRRAAAEGLTPIRFNRLSPPKGTEVFDTDIVQGYAIDVSKEEITLAAHTRVGFQNALYALLDRWGCRWVMFGKIGEVTPKRTALTLPLGRIKSPKCHHMAVQASGGRGDVSNWWARNQGGFAYWMSGQHYWFYALPEEKYFKDHPEWYARIGGKRVPTQLCTTNPEVIAKMIEVAKEFFRNRPEALSFPMDPMDNIDFCQCDRCRAQDPPGSDPMGLPLMTDRVVHFANAVARGIAKDYPDRVVAFYAYNNHTLPPVNVKPEKNISVGITRSMYCILHLMPRKDCPKSLEFYELVRQWRKLVPRVWVYEYDPISWTGSLPCPIYMDRAASISLLFKTYGVWGGVTDYVPYLVRSYPGTYINAYFERRAKADPERTPDAILTDLCGGFFGPAAGPMEAYYRELAKVTEYKHPGRAGVAFGTYKYQELFNPGMVTAARKHLDEAMKAAAGQSPYQDRLRLIDMSQRYLESYLGGVWSAQAKDYDRAEAAFARMDAVMAEMDRAGVIDLADSTARMKSARMKALAEYFPDRLGLVRTWKLLGPFDNSRRDADLRVDPFEPITSIGQPVKLSDGSTMAWTPYTSPEGLLNLETAEKAHKHPWSLSYFYAGVTLSAPKARKVEFRMDSFCPFKVYLNGKEVYYRPGLDADCPDKRTVPVELPAGRSTVVFKLSHTVWASDSFPWGLYFRVTDRTGKPIPGIVRPLD